jgi:hypothetical protein
LGHLTDPGEAVEQGKLGVDVEVDEVAVPARIRGSKGHGPMVVGSATSVRPTLTSVAVVSATLGVIAGR